DRGIVRIGSDVAVFFDARGMPIAKADLPEIAPTRRGDRTALLLRSIDPIRKAVVGGHVEELRGRLVVPRAPGLPTVHADGRSLVAAQRDDLGMLGIHPDPLVVVSARRPFDGGEGPSAVDGSIGSPIRDIDDVRIVRGHRNAVRSGPTASHCTLRVHPLPVFAPVVGSKDSAPLPWRLGQQVDPLWQAGGDGDTDPTPILGLKQATRRSPPVAAAVSGLDHPSPGRFEGLPPPNSPGRTPPRPNSRLHGLRVPRFDRELARAVILVAVETFPPTFTAIET